jgi:hypothetical protein
MANVAVGSQHLLGAGRVSVAMYVNGTLEIAERFLGNNDQFDITPTVERIEIRDSTTADNALLDSGETQRSLKLAIRMREFSKENLALQQMGTLSTYAQSNTPVVDEVVVVVAKDRSFQLGGYLTPARNVTSVVVKHTSGSPTYVLGTDYTQDLKQGKIYIPTSSPILAGASIKVSYTPTTETRNLVSIGQAADVDALVRFESNARRGPKIDALLWHVQFSGASAMSLVNPTEYSSLALEGNILSDELVHPTAKYGWLITP